MEEVRFDLFLKKEQDLAKGNLTCEGKEGEFSEKAQYQEKGSTWRNTGDETR